MADRASCRAVYALFTLRTIATSFIFLSVSQKSVELPVKNKVLYGKQLSDDIK